MAPATALRCLVASIAATMLAGACAHAAAPPPALDTTEQRVQPCIACHGDQGRAMRDGYYPRIAGKPAGYLFNQLLNFRDDRRHFPMMVYLTSLQNEDYLREIAGYFAALHVPYQPPQPPKVSPIVLERGRLLATDGDPSLHISSCRSCHGARLLGVAPAVPGLLGVSQDYLIAQLSDWRLGIRTALAPDCMSEIARRMRREDLNAVTAWLATQAVPDDTEPDRSFADPPPLQCGSILSAAAVP